MNSGEDDEFWQEGDVDGNRLPPPEASTIVGGSVLPAANEAAIAAGSDSSSLNEKLSGDTHPYDRLSPDAIIAAVESTGLRSDARILALNSYENRVYQVGVDDAEPVVVKFYRPDRWTADQIREEHHFCHFLNELDIPVVAPTRISGDDTIAEYDGFLFAIFPRQGGRPPELDNLDHLEQLGQFPPDTLPVCMTGQRLDWA